MTDIALIAKGLSKAQRAALATLPLPCAADPFRWQAARTFGSLWRKSSRHWDAMLDLEEAGIVERRISRGETLWRPTKPLGLSLREYLERNPND